MKSFAIYNGVTLSQIQRATLSKQLVSVCFSNDDSLLMIGDNMGDVYIY